MTNQTRRRNYQTVDNGPTIVNANIAPCKPGGPRDTSKLGPHAYRIEEDERDWPTEPLPRTAPSGLPTVEALRIELLQAELLDLVELAHVKKEPRIHEIAVEVATLSMELEREGSGYRKHYQMPPLRMAFSLAQQLSHYEDEAQHRFIEEAYGHTNTNFMNKLSRAVAGILRLHRIAVAIPASGS